MGLPTDVARIAGRNLGPSSLRSLLRALLAGTDLALCLHRVHEGRRRTGEPLPEMSLRASAADELIDRLREAEPRALTVTFDDGYARAARYVRRCAEQRQDVQFLFFVCPRKAELGEPFQWDLDEPAFRLANVEDCLALSRLRNVRLGNHGNSHQRLATLTSEELRAELLHSHEDFSRLFGATAEFAIPYGTPGAAFGRREVALLRALGYSRVWSTEPRPVRRADEEVGVLPRYAIDGTWSVQESLSWIAVRALVSKLPRGREEVVGAGPPAAA